MLFQSPHYTKDVILLEKMQRGFTWMLFGIDRFSNEERLDGLALLFPGTEDVKGEGGGLL